ncbi:DUF1194 domain-containing protein [Aestuariivirga sp.]|uniref:DUF1194 domain-containing protein n=1 Tax=Aestuariivirga sp. TaxID=2650926 RepID=UPI00391C749D
MKFGISTAVLVGAAMFLPILQPAIAGNGKAAPSCIDVALVLAVDSSASVSRQEFDLQQSGIAAAFRDPAGLDAIASAGRVVVSVVFWGAEGLPKPQSNWVFLEGKEGAEVFARTVESMPRQVTGDTGLGAGLMTALDMLNSLDSCTLRKIVNVSGDGEETRVHRRPRRSPAPPQVRDLADTQNVEINALAIVSDEAELASYYAENVITGPDAFVMEVLSYDAFAEALRRKLIREIGPRVISDLPPKNSKPDVLTDLPSPP